MENGVDFRDTGMRYRNAVLKGELLFRAFVHPANQSVWTDHSFLERHGWAIHYTAPGKPFPQETSRVKVYNDLGLSTDPDDNIKIALMHIYESQPGGPDTKVYRPTFGFYTCLYNPRVIIANFSENPVSAGNVHLVTGEDVVPLKYWSDVIFLQWQSYCHDDRPAMRQLSCIMQANVMNRTTHRIVEEALERAELEMREWEDGPATFPIDSKECQAILATPNGVGPAHFLTQHKSQLGDLMITAVTVFSRGSWIVNPAALQICFHIAPME